MRIRRPRRRKRRLRRKKSYDDVSSGDTGLAQDPLAKRVGLSLGKNIKA